ncbi:hypothetical protein LS482_04905 [Sinomicrobium kalidii]|uniref:GH36-type glycosyl hydrolase domain-containing protein n=1 Tax=Sinomicrobium kalidii TaxID=2900738 RepID=UPI001E583617|nr:hypothetical protein [Sinomicrobium kalidii]UGU17210.1 hypothetical protein LS482_04905 [Sinomicrobium kalidii]
MKYILLTSLLLPLFFTSCGRTNSRKNPVIQTAYNDTKLHVVREKALQLAKTGFNAGDGYAEVWIRDYNTFVNLAAEVNDKDILKENLRVFFRLQGKDGNIVDGFVPKNKAGVSEGGYNYIHTELEKKYAGHKNTVETDQETSLVQAVYKYVIKTGDTAFLQEKIGGKKVSERLELAMEFLLQKRYDKKHGLIWGATTADWGDVQPEHEWGVFLTEDTHYAIDIYDNAMFIIALTNMTELIPETTEKWKKIRDSIAENAMKYLWDEENEKFIPHIYLNGSPFPDDLNENEIYYHGGTAVAIRAGLLSEKQIEVSLQKMVDNMKRSGASTIGLTLYPPYPEGAFLNKGMYPYGYQNGGDWTWFGGRMVIALFENGFEKEAYEHMGPMLDRVIENNGFFEWYTLDNTPKGSASFKGSAGVLYDAVELFLDQSE